MDDIELRVFNRRFLTLCREVNTSDLSLVLLEHGVISVSACKTFLSSQHPGTEESADLFVKLSKICDMDSLILYLRQSGHVKHADEISEEIQKEKSSNILSTPQMCTVTYRDNIIDKFAEKIKAKIHNAKAVTCRSDFQRWISRLLCNLNAQNLSLREERKLADFCFVFLDTLIVLERTHSASREDLFRRPEFQQMRSIIMKSSNPTLMRIRYNSRYGMALAQAGETEKALENLQTALDDAHCYCPGKDIGNALFAIVNVKLQIYSLNKSPELKCEILSLIEQAVRYFENEDEEVLLNWKGIYLIKNAYCHLGIDAIGNDVVGADIEAKDTAKAAYWLNELERILEDLDIRRKMHFYRAKAKLHSLKFEQRIADGYLQQALELASRGGFLADLKVIESCIDPKLQPKRLRQPSVSIAPCRRRIPSEHEVSVVSNRTREPSEHDESIVCPTLIARCASSVGDNDLICDALEPLPTSNIQREVTCNRNNEVFSPVLRIENNLGASRAVERFQQVEDLEQPHQEPTSPRNERSLGLLNTCLNAICRLLHLEVININNNG